MLIYVLRKGTGTKNVKVEDRTFMYSLALIIFVVSDFPIGSNVNF